MEGDPEAPRLVGHRRNRRVLGFRQPAKARGGFEDRVSMAHPDRQFRGQVVKEASPLLDVDVCRAVLTFAGRRDLSAELIGKELHAIADAQHRNAGIERRRIAARGAVLVNAGRSSGEDERLRRAQTDRLPGRGPRDQLAVDAGLADAPGDQLAVLRPKIEDEHEILGPHPALRRQLVPSPACGGG